MKRAQDNLTTLKTLTFLGLIFLFGCSEKQKSECQQYSIYTMADDNKEYINQVDNLATGELDPIQKGVRTYPKQIWFDLIVKDGFYFRLERKTNYFLKYTVENNRYIPVDSVKLSGMSYLDNYNWVHSDTVFLTSFDRKVSKLSYARVNIKTMKADIGTLPVSLPKPPFNSMSIGFSMVRAGKLFLGYTYYEITSQHVKAADSVYIDVLTYPDLKLVKTIKDSRSSYPGGANTAQPNTFTDRHGDFYFLACPGIALGNNPEKPTSLYRIKKDEDKLDSTFFWNISESIKNHGYGLWNIGSGKAIIRSERKDLFTGVEDHYKVPHIEFYVLDLNKKTAKKLELPLDKGTSRQCILVENGLVYLSVNSESGNYIWIYNPKDNTLKKGLKIKDDIDYILRIERLYEELK